MQPPSELIPTRATLLQRLKNWEDQASWQDFFDTYWELIYNVARQSRLTEIEAQDVVQETMVSVAKQMPGFKYDPKLGEFKGWLLNLTRWRIVDQIRKRESHLVARLDQESVLNTSNFEDVIDPNGRQLEEMWQSEWEKNLLEAAMARAKKRLDPRNYQIFDLHVNRAWEPARVAAALAVSVDQVYLAKHRVSEMIREEIKRLEANIT
jgi:RNA polymerase sigma-70 factor (ECF subfamily)